MAAPKCIATDSDSDSDGDGVVVLRFEGRMTMGSGGDVVLHDAISNALERKHAKVLLDLSGVVGKVDSVGIGELISAFTTVKNRGGKLSLCSLPAQVSDILQITQLITVFEVYDTEGEALASFL